MLLLHYLQLKKQEADVIAARSCRADGNSKEFGRCLGSVRAFAGDNADLLSLADPAFAQAYARFICEEYEGGTLSLTTKKKHIVALRTLARAAATEGYTPAVDVFAPVRRSRFGGSASGRPRAPYALSPYGVKARVQQAVGYAFGADASLAAPAAAYLHALLLGMELQPALGAPAYPSAVGAALADKARGASAESVARFMHASGIALLRSGSVAADALALAKEQGAPDALVAGAVQALLGGADSVVALAPLAPYGAAPLLDSVGLQPRWHVLVGAIGPLHGTRFRAALDDFVALSGLKLRSSDIYNPLDMHSGQRTGREGHTAVSRYIFFRAPLADTRRLNAEMPGAYVLRSPGSDRFAVVSEKEIAALQALLCDFRADVSLVDADQLAQLRDSQLAVDTRVRILSGPLAGREATVAAVKAGSGARLYRVLFAEGALAIEATLPGVALSPLTP